MTVNPVNGLKPIMLDSFGKLQSVNGVSVCTFLSERQVAARQAKAARDWLSHIGYKVEIQVENDHSNPIQKGSSIVLWAKTDKGAIVGADSIGEVRKMAEDVGKEAAQRLLVELFAKPTIDIYLADMLIPYMALARGNSVIVARTISEHIESNIWLMQKMLDVKFSTTKMNNLFRIEKTS
jgi:RNA 3'-terminal phosphate cyclase